MDRQTDNSNDLKVSYRQTSCASWIVGFQAAGWLNGGMDGWTDGCMGNLDGWMHVWVVWMGEWMSCWEC